MALFSMASVVDSFFISKKGKKKRGDGNRTIPKRQPFTSVRGNKAPSDKTARSWQKKPNYTTFAHEINRGSILSTNQIKKIIVDNVAGMTGANATGISIFAGLLDMGITKAITVANEIVRQARQQGVNSQTFGHSVHATLAKQHPEASRFMTANPTEESQAYFDRKAAIGKQRYNKISQLQSFKDGTRIRAAYQKLPPLEKKWWKDLKKAMAHVQDVGMSKAKTTTAFARLFRQGGDVETIMKRMYGEEAITSVYGSLLTVGNNGTISLWIGSPDWFFGAAHKWNHTDTIYASYCLNSIISRRSQPVFKEVVDREYTTIKRKINSTYKALEKYAKKSIEERAAFQKQMNKAYSLFDAVQDNAEYFTRAGVYDTISADYQIKSVGFMAVKNMMDVVYDNITGKGGGVPPGPAPAAAGENDVEFEDQV